MAELQFEGQRDNERILGIWRRNPATLIKEGFVVLGLTLIVVGSFVVFGASLVTSLLLGLWLILVPFYAGLAWYRWWNDLYILTSQRLVDVDQHHLFHRMVTELPLENIQDATFEVRGILPTLLNYGTVSVMTASGSTEIDIEGVTDPQAVQQKVLRAVRQVSGDDTPPKSEKQSTSKSKPKTQLG